MNAYLTGIIAGLALGITAMAENTNTFQGSVELPDVLRAQDGKVIQTLNDWEKIRKPELMKTFTEQMYGVMPGKPESIEYTVFESSTNAMNGLATRKQIAIKMKNAGKETSVDLLLYVPNEQKAPAPLIMCLNFKGNHATTDDPAVKVCEKPIHSDRKEPYARNEAAERWPYEMILKRGYAIATMCHGDIVTDSKGPMNDYVFSLFPELQNRPDNFTAIGAWAWTISRALDYLVTLPEINPKQLTVVGHSRLGKTSLWCGANDPRFTVVISNDSGEGGAALSRRMQGETIADLCRNFPYWFCKNYQQYVGHDKEMPFDQHELISLIAPRHVYVASASEDAWADPEGEFTSLKLANPVFKIYGVQNALPADTMPEIEKPVHGYNGYHLRAGKHNILEYDWSNYLQFMDEHFGRTQK